MSDITKKSAPAESPLLQVDNLVKCFGALRAVDGVSLELHRGEILGVVGESGCGKSTLAKTIFGLTPATSGRVTYDGRTITGLSNREMRQIRREIQFVFQDPYSSLNPRMTVFDLISEPWVIFPDLVPRKNWKIRVGALLERVGLNPADAGRFPHQFSGGQRQRIGIARALAMSPRVLICDEPVSALDVSVQAQVVNLLTDLRNDLGISLIFIAHNLQIVRHISDRIAVMYLGRVVEIGTWDEIYDRATHPYTQALISAIPDPDPALAQQRILLQGDVPNPANPPSGCRFRTRCWKATDLCARDTPELKIRQNTDHPSACHFAEQRKLVQA